MPYHHAMVGKLLKSLGILVLAIVLVIGGLTATMRASVPDDRFELQRQSTAETSEPGHYLLFGASRNTGLEVARILRTRGDRVTAFVRPSSDRSALEAIGAEFVVGDALQMDTVEASFRQGPYQAVVTTIGCFGCDPIPDFEANRNIIDAAKVAGVERLLLVTSIGAGDSKPVTPWVSRMALKKILPLKDQAEAHLIASDLDYTIIRPGGLSASTPSGRGLLSENPGTFGYIHRADLAALMVGCLDDPRSIGKTLAAIDSQRPWFWSE